MSWKRILAHLAMVVMLLHVFPVPVHALKCAGPATVEEELARSTQVFMGTAMRKGHDAVYTFEVKQVYKGKVTRQLDVSFTDMSFPVELGQTYLVYAAKYNGKLAADPCGRTKLWEQARTEDAYQLPSFTVPPTPSSRPQITDAPWGYWVFSAVIVALGIVLGAYLRRKRRD
jgi:hypothetical protein